MYALLRLVGIEEGAEMDPRTLAREAQERRRATRRIRKRYVTSAPFETERGARQAWRRAQQKRACIACTGKTEHQVWFCVFCGQNAQEAGRR